MNSYYSRHLALLCLVLTLFPLTIQQNVPLAPSLLNITAQGSVLVIPNQVSLSCKISAKNATVSLSFAQIEAKTSDAMTILRDNGVQENQIEVFYLVMVPGYDDPYANPTIGLNKADFFVGHRELQFILSNMTNFNTIMNGLYALEVDNVGIIDFEVTNQKNYIQAAQDIALQNAIKKANLFAQTTGLELGEFYHVMYGVNSIIQSSKSHDVDEIKVFKGTHSNSPIIFSTSLTLKGGKLLLECRG